VPENLSGEFTARIKFLSEGFKINYPETKFTVK
jgi:hypothetical protein